MTVLIITQMISKWEKSAHCADVGEMIVSFESVNFRRANPVAWTSNLLDDALPGLKVFTCEKALDR